MGISVPTQSEFVVLACAFQPEGSAAAPAAVTIGRSGDSLRFLHVRAQSRSARR